MKIECPNCHLGGQVSDINVPPEGLNMECPRCKTSFFVKRQQAASWHDTASDCPVCQYSTFSDERFDICPRCGVVVKEYNERKSKGGGGGRQLPPAPPLREAPIDLAEVGRRAEADLRRLEEQSAKRRFAQEAHPPPPAAEEVVKVELPLQVTLTGWAYVVAAAIATVYSGLQISSYYAQLREVAGDQLLADEFAASHSVWEGLVFPGVQILLAAATIVVALFFLRLRPWARKGLEYLSWGGISYLALAELVSLFNWIRRSPDGSSFLYYFIGVVTTLVMLAIWVAPLLGAIWFLRDERIGGAFEE